MSDILIRGMEMPKSCGYCPLRHEARDGDECYLGASMTEYQKRPDDCPLVPIPPHGDLVDLIAPFKAQYLDEMTEEWEEKMVTVGDVLYSCMVDEMPPITIPAEEGEK